MLYLLVRGNPHTLRRFCRAEEWIPQKAENSATTVVPTGLTADRNTHHNNLGSLGTVPTSMPDPTSSK